jgi:hypothetical protein
MAGIARKGTDSNAPMIAMSRVLASLVYGLWRDASSRA